MNNLWLWKGKMNFMKIKLFTHTDLDGVGCAVVGKKAFGDVLDVQFCGYSTVNERVTNFIKSGEVEQYDAVFITDISVNEEVAELIDSTVGFKVQLLDHHGTALWLNKYEWAYVSEVEEPLVDKTRDEVKSSGTTLFYGYLLDSKLLPLDKKLLDFCEQVRQYDSWEWKNVYENELANQLNTLFQILGLFNFYNRFSKNPEVIFNKTEQTILEIEQSRVKHYLNQKEQELEIRSILGYKVGVIFAEQYASQLGNYLAETHRNLDFIMMINMSGTISYRGVRDDIDLGEVAKQFGGGGHPKASGSPIPPEERGNVIDYLLERLI